MTAAMTEAHTLEAIMKLDAGLKDLEHRVGNRLTRLETRVVALEGRAAQTQDPVLRELEERLDSIETIVDRIATKLDA